MYLYCMPSCGGTGAAGRADNKMGPLGFPTVVTIQQTQEEEIGQVAPGRTPAFKNRDWILSYSTEMELRDQE